MSSPSTSSGTAGMKKHMVLPLSRLHDVRGEWRALMAASHLCPKRWITSSSNELLDAYWPCGSCGKRHESNNPYRWRFRG